MIDDLTTTIRHKSSYSGASGGDCLEVATWRKSTYSGGSGGDRLEVADGHPGVVPAPFSVCFPGLKPRSPSALSKEWVEGSTPPTLPSRGVHFS
ncbi:DUF397 domain-containing protein [Streptomyces sp. NPDC057565]|uniref:DUF397 domain-containing protein n=1 Tax=Streptomyces sp. NPDC057565 TaxID=3346169 RepID=UPI00369591B6